MTEKALRNFWHAAKGFVAEVILIDNGSEQKLSVSLLEELTTSKIENINNFGFARAVNQALAVSTGEYCLLLNSDALLDEAALQTTIKYLDENQSVGIAGIKMVYPDGNIQPTCGNFPNLFNELMRFSKLSKILPGGSVIFSNKFNLKIFNNPTFIDWVSGGCMFIRRKLIDEIGLLDENFFFGVEDIDYCHRAKDAGWKNVYFPLASVVHYHSFSSGGKRSEFTQNNERIGMKYYWKKYGRIGLTGFIVNMLYLFKMFYLRIAKNLKIIK